MGKNFYFFIDESGNPNFYAKGGRPLWDQPDFEPVLMLGMLVINDRRALRKQVLAFQQQVLLDPLYNTIYSVQQPDWFLHASKDHSDVRLKFFEHLRHMENISCFVIVARKNPDIFHHKHNGNATEFYFDILNKLLQRIDYQAENKYHLYLSKRQSSTLDRFEAALKKALAVQSKKHDAVQFKCRITPSTDYPEMSVIDYLMWALRRYITAGDGRYLKATQHLFKEIYDIYDENEKGVVYTEQNPFSLEKASPYHTK
jgi:Protein of unknown function (DUF3800)